NPAFLGSGNHQVYYVYTDGNGCRDTAQQTLIVHAPPSISLTAFNSYCDNSLPDTLTQGLPKGGIYTSTAGGIINDSIFDASLVLPGTYTIVYTYTDTNGCDSSLSGSLTVNNLPLPQFLVPTLDMCIDGDSVSIANSVSLPAMPPIGFFTGPGIDSSGTFNPAITGVGSFDIYYTYTDANNCTNTTVSPRSIFVHNLPV